MNHPGESLYAGNTPLFQETNERQWESSRVEYLLRKTSPDGQARSWIQRVIAQVDGMPEEGRLTWWGLRLQFSGMPIQLGSTRGDEKLHIQAGCLLPALLTKFKTSPLMRLYTRWAADQAADTPCGLVLPFKGVQHGIIVHNGPVKANPAFVYRREDDRAVIVETYQAFVASLDWRPD